MQHPPMKRLNERELLHARSILRHIERYSMRLQGLLSRMNAYVDQINLELFLDNISEVPFCTKEINLVLFQMLPTFMQFADVPPVPTPAPADTPATGEPIRLGTVLYNSNDGTVTLCFDVDGQPNTLRVYLEWERMETRAGYEQVALFLRGQVPQERFTGMVYREVSISEAMADKRAETPTVQGVSLILDTKLL